MSERKVFKSKKASSSDKEKEDGPPVAVYEGDAPAYSAPSISHLKRTARACPLPTRPALYPPVSSPSVAPSVWSRDSLFIIEYVVGVSFFLASSLSLIVSSVLVSPSSFPRAFSSLLSPASSSLSNIALSIIIFSILGAPRYQEIKRVRAIEKRKRRAKRKREVEQLGDQVRLLSLFLLGSTIVGFVITYL